MGVLYGIIGAAQDLQDDWGNEMALCVKEIVLFISEQTNQNVG